MEIQNEITRIENAKRDIRASVIAKGGIINDTQLIDTYALSIDNIPTGGSGFTGSVDREGLLSIGWTEDDIDNFVNGGGIDWNAEDDESYKVTDELKSIYANYNADTFRDSEVDKIVWLPSWDFSNIETTYMAYYFTTIVNLKGTPLIIFQTTQERNNFSYMFQGLNNLSYVNQIRMVNDNADSIDCIGMFQYCANLIGVSSNIIDVSTSYFINGNSMFQYCCRLKQVPAQVYTRYTSMNSMFGMCSSIDNVANVSINIFDDNVGISAMFFRCKNLKTNVNSLIPIGDLSYSSFFNGSGVQSLHLQLSSFYLANNMSSLFSNCQELVTDEFVTSVFNQSYPNLTSIGNLFEGCHSLVNVPSFTLPSTVTPNAVVLFRSCSRLESVGTITSSAFINNLGSSFSFCPNLKTIGNININTNTSNGLILSSLFEGCPNLTDLRITLSKISTFTNITNINNTFKDCTNLKYVPKITFKAGVSGTSTNAFLNCTSLLSIDIRDLNSDLDLSTCPNLTNASIANLFTYCRTLTTTNRKTIKLGSINYNKMTASQRAVATNKYWYVTV